MSPEFYAIIGIGVGLASLIVALGGLTLYLIGQVNRRIDRLEHRLDRLEDRLERIEERLERLVQEMHYLDLRVSKLEWMLDAALYGKPVRIPPESDNGDPG